MKNKDTRAEVMIALMRARDKISDLKAIYSGLINISDEYETMVGNDNLYLNGKQCILALNDLAILTDIMNADVLSDIDAMSEEAEETEAETEETEEEKIN